MDIDSTHPGVGSLGQFAALYGENKITADAVGLDIPNAETTLVAMSPEDKQADWQWSPDRTKVRSLDKFASPCSQYGGCPDAGLCGHYAMACQAFYQWVAGPVLGASVRADNPLYTPCREMYLKVFTQEDPDALPVPPVNYIVRENQTLQEMEDACRSADAAAR